MEAIFGRLTLEGPDPVFVPLSVVHRKESPPIVYLARDVALVDGLGLKPKLAFGPVRVAVTGAGDGLLSVRRPW